MSQSIPLCLADSLREGQARGFDPDNSGQATVIALRYRGEIFLWRNVCPHLGTPMNWRRDAFMDPAGEKLVCFAHGAIFEPDSGLCIQGACLGQRLTELNGYIDARGWLMLTESDKYETGNAK
ncbi:Rieske (2Fe-2S) protein [Buttiauxella warmboldiae]|uniref:Rieske (2Fe-2S) protein n=1 Tax=Buttiauxella warmboldiae TaxID=82993 RepID=A0A3N5DRL1_9ENTR|nr:Rieske (2Fe-2S) protein [Buttiauxella warmboldiae]RPH30187.1 Rieske (2Fe-2S) protein [Buttiauxella warmboldiae]